MDNYGIMICIFIVALIRRRYHLLMSLPWLQLIPAYRGYTIDSLKLLDILDDIPISADERHHYKGLTKRKGIKPRKLTWYSTIIFNECSKSC